MSVEAVMLWNEPNNLAHWDFQIDEGWKIYGAMVKLAASEIRREKPSLVRVLGGISPIDPEFVLNMREQGVLDELDVVAVHGYPFDWNRWQIEDWPAKLTAIRAVTNKPIWVSEIGASSFGSEEVQELGLRRSVDLLTHRVPRIHWCSLYDLPRSLAHARIVTNGARGTHDSSEGKTTTTTTAGGDERASSSDERDFCMGLLKQDGTPKRALRYFARCTPEIGICQWFQHEDARLEDAVQWMKRLGVKKLRTGLSWADSCNRPRSEAWLDRLMTALSCFDVTLTFESTPWSLGLREDPTSPPRDIEAFAELCTRMVRRYC